MYRQGPSIGKLAVRLKKNRHPPMHDRYEDEEYRTGARRSMNTQVIHLPFSAIRALAPKKKVTTFSKKIKRSELAKPETTVRDYPQVESSTHVFRWSALFTRQSPRVVRRDRNRTSEPALRFPRYGYRCTPRISRVFTQPVGKPRGMNRPDNTGGHGHARIVREYW